MSNPPTVTKPLKVAILTTEARDYFRRYDGLQPSFATAPTALLSGFEDLPGVEVHVVSCAQQPMKSPEKLAANIYYHCVHAPKLGWMRTLYQGCVRATRRKLREISPDIVHGQGTERECAICAVRSGFPAVITIHGNMAALARQFHARIGSFHWLAGWLEDWTLPRSQGVLCNSQYTEDLVRPRAQRVWRVPNALRTEFFGPLPQRPTGAIPHLVNVGALTPRKRQVELLQAARRLHGRGCVFRLDFIGSIDERDPYARSFRRELDRPGTDAFAGYLPYQDNHAIVATFDRADACIHFPSEEAFGLVVAEALSRNLKFFGSRVGGPVEITSGVEGAELFGLEDWTGLENALASWIQNGAPRPTSAAQTMRERYHPHVIAQRHVEIYREVLAHPVRR